MFQLIDPERAPLIAVDDYSKKTVYLREAGAPELVALLVAQKIGRLLVKRTIDRTFIMTVADLVASSMFSFGVSEETYGKFLEDVVTSYEEAFGFESPFFVTSMVYQGQLCHLDSTPGLVEMVQDHLRDREERSGEPESNQGTARTLREEVMGYYGL